ncbi:hypothetical protein AU476_10430 [Cupriavidus sp. UYMSc13B]|nr:hypothetical protein AU476_10430 [Cupriavidus sp. UYMSc13B]
MVAELISDTQRTVLDAISCAIADHRCPYRVFELIDRTAIEGLANNLTDAYGKRRRGTPLKVVDNRGCRVFAEKVATRFVDFGYELAEPSRVHAFVPLTARSAVNFMHGFGLIGHLHCAHRLAPM